MQTTHVTRHIHASCSAVYQALLDPQAIPHWKVPDGMTCHIHSFAATEGGTFRISLTYDAPTSAGKSTAQTDTYHGRFAKLVPDEQIVEIDQCETDDPSMQGEMTITYTLTDAANAGTDLHALHEGLPDGVSPADNELGWQMSLSKLAALVEKPNSH